MNLHGKQLIGVSTSAAGERTFLGFNPTAGKALEPTFTEATSE